MGGGRVDGTWMVREHFHLTTHNLNFRGKDYEGERHARAREACRVTRDDLHRKQQVRARFLEKHDRGNARAVA